MRAMRTGPQRIRFRRYAARAHVRAGETVSDAPKVLGREMQQRGTRWLAKFGPLEYVIETAQPHIADGDCITWIYYDYATNGARCAGRSVPIIGPLHWCVAAIERELLSIRATIPGEGET